MENLDIIILTSVLSTLFLVFGILVCKEFFSSNENSYVDNMKNGGPRVQLMKFMQRLFDEDAPINEKKVILKAINRTISDMESDGVYFSKDVKEELKRQRDELNCEYSGLMSVKFYDKDK